MYEVKQYDLHKFRVFLKQVEVNYIEWILNIFILNYTIERASVY